MNYIVHTRIKGKMLCGEVNIPACSECIKIPTGMIIYKNKPLCYATSYIGHKHICRNDDGQGLLRGDLLKRIQKKLEHRDAEYQLRWNKIWEDAKCKKFKRVEHPDHWLWNDDFFEATIEDLKYIANLIGLKES